MNRLSRVLLNILMIVAILGTIWREFPIIPVLYGCMTAASLLFAWICLFSRQLPLTREAQAVPEEVRRSWCLVLGILFAANAALCPLGFLLRQFLPFDQDLILVAQVAGFFILCFASVIPVSRGRGK